MRSHFVPQFYLKNFGDPIYAYDKKEKKIRKSSSANLAVERDFYGPAGADKTHPLETAMSGLEGDVNIVIKKMMDTLSYSKLSNKEKLVFRYFVALQRLRTPEAKILTEQIAQKIIDVELQEKGITDFEIKQTKEGKLQAHRNTMSNAETIADILHKMGVMICSNATDVPLWTSDNPVTLHNMIDQFPFGNLGLACEGIEVHIPLSPRLKVMFFDPVTYPQQRMPELLPMEEGHVIRSNHLQTWQSTRFMYSNTAKFFMANRYLESDPESGNVDRERMRTGNLATGFGALRERKFHKKPKFWMQSPH